MTIREALIQAQTELGVSREEHDPSVHAVGKLKTPRMTAGQDNQFYSHRDTEDTATDLHIFGFDVTPCGPSRSATKTEG